MRKERQVTEWLRRRTVVEGSEAEDLTREEGKERKSECIRGVEKSK